jgi:hypothetical protein
MPTSVLETVEEHQYLAYCCTTDSAEIDQTFSADEGLIFGTGSGL